MNELTQKCYNAVKLAQRQDKLQYMRGSFPTQDDNLVVKFKRITDNMYVDYMDIEYFEGGFETAESYLIKKYGIEETRRICLGAIRNAVEVL